MRDFGRFLNVFGKLTGGGAAEINLALTGRKKGLPTKLHDDAVKYLRHLGIEPDKNHRMTVAKFIEAVEAQSSNHIHAARMQRIESGQPTKEDVNWLKDQAMTFVGIYSDWNRDNER